MGRSAGRSKNVEEGSGMNEKDVNAPEGKEEPAGDDGEERQRMREDDGSDAEGRVG